MLNTRVEVLSRSNGRITGKRANRVYVCNNNMSLNCVNSRTRRGDTFRQRPSNDAVCHDNSLNCVLPSNGVTFLRHGSSRVVVCNGQIRLTRIRSQLCQYGSIRRTVIQTFASRSKLSCVATCIIPSSGGLGISRMGGRLSRGLASFVVPRFFIGVGRVPLGIGNGPSISGLPIMVGTKTLW